MNVTRRLVMGVAAAGALPMAALAQTPALKFGVLTDMSGPYKDLAGPLAVQCAHQALEDFGAAAKGINVEVLVADHQNKPDVGAGTARAWFDRDGVDLVLEVANSGVALAVASVAKEKNKVYINSGAATSDLTGAQCNANTVHWTYDTYMLAKSTGAAMVKAGGDSWYFITADYAFGHAMTRDTTQFIAAAGGKVLGDQSYPFPGTTDFSSQLLAAQASGAKVIGLSSAGADTINQIKQAKEFGLAERGIKLAGLLVFISDVHALGLETAQGLVVTNSFYWDGNPRTRAFAERLKPKAPTLRPTMVHAGVYASTLHYLKTVQAMGVAEAKKDGAATVARMKAIPTEDDAFGAGSIRADGRVIHPSFLWEVKKPSESKAPWDYYKPLATTPGRPGIPAAGRGEVQPGDVTYSAASGTGAESARMSTITSPARTFFRECDVQILLPRADHDGRDAVADQVAQRAGHADEPVDRQHQHQADRGDGRGTAFSVAARMTMAEPGTPCAPFDVTSDIPSTSSRSPKDSGVLVACAMNTVASVR